LTPSSLVEFTNVSEESITSICQVKEKAEKEMSKQTYFLGLSFDPDAAQSFETPANYQGTTTNIPEERQVHVIITTARI
jgi:hypothetical protein